MNDGPYGFPRATALVNVLQRSCDHDLGAGRHRQISEECHGLGRDAVVVKLLLRMTAHRAQIDALVGVASVWAENPKGGRRRTSSLRDNARSGPAAAVEVLRMTGLRVEGLTELTHHSLVQYQLPGTDELTPRW